MVKHRLAVGLCLSFAALSAPAFAEGPDGGDKAEPKPPAPAKADEKKVDEKKVDDKKAPEAPRGDDARPPGDTSPAVHHAPPSVRAMGEDVLLAATLDHPERVRRVVVAVRTPKGWKDVELRRAATGSYAAVIPGVDVQPPGFAYAIELETTDGAKVAVFATRERPHEVRVDPSADAERERAQLARADGRRSVVWSGVDYARFGTVATRLTQPPADGSPQDVKVHDQYWRAEAGYTYRMYGLVSEFGIRIGVVRGTSAVPSARTTNDFAVGLNYGSPHVRFRVSDWVHVDASALTSVTEVGFSLGGGGQVVLGDPMGQRFTFGVESVRTFGTRVYSRLDLPVTSRVGIAPVIEVTDMPHAEKTGVRLLLETRVDVGAGFSVAARTGYQARSAASGGPGLGLSAAYAF